MAQPCEQTTHSGHETEPTKVMAHQKTLTVDSDRSGPNPSHTPETITPSKAPTLEESFARIPHLLDKEDVIQMINLQVTAIDRLESANRSLSNCNALAHSKLDATTKLFKKTARQMNETKHDLDVIYKKITDLKAKIKANRAHPISSANNPEQAATHETSQPLSVGSPPELENELVLLSPEIETTISAPLEKPESKQVQ